MFRAFFERRRVRKVLGRVVRPEAVEAILRGDDIEHPPLQHGRIEFILTFVRGESPAEISERIARVADSAVTHGATVHGLVGALVIVTFGTRPASSPESGGRLSLVHALRAQLAGDIKIVHGAADGHYGLFGGERHMSYTFLVPQFDNILGALSRLQFGQSEEFTR